MTPTISIEKIGPRHRRRRRHRRRVHLIFLGSVCGLRVVQLPLRSDIQHGCRL